MDRSKNKINNCLSSPKMHKKKYLTLEIPKLVDVCTLL